MQPRTVIKGIDDSTKVLFAFVRENDNTRTLCRLFQVSILVRQKRWLFAVNLGICYIVFFNTLTACLGLLIYWSINWRSCSSGEITLHSYFKVRLAPPFQQLWQKKTVNIIYSKLLKTAQMYAAPLFQPANINIQAFSGQISHPGKSYFISYFPAV